MPTQIVAIGEMDTITFRGEMDGSLEELIEELRMAAAQKLDADGESSWCFVERTYESYVIVSLGKRGGEQKFYKVDYAKDGDKVVLGEPVEVERKWVYEPISGEMDSGGEQIVTWKELIAQLKGMLDKKEVTLGQVIGEMGLTAQLVAGEMADVKTAFDAADTLNKVKEALGVSGEMDVVAVAKASAEAAAAKAKADHEAMVAEVLKEKVKGEMAQGLVMRMLQVPAGATKEQVAGEIDKLLADEKVKAAIDRLYTDAPLPKPGVGDPAPQNIKVIRAAI